MIFTKGPTFGYDLGKTGNLPNACAQNKSGEVEFASTTPTHAKPQSGHGPGSERLVIDLYANRPRPGSPYKEGFRPDLTQEMRKVGKNYQGPCPRCSSHDAFTFFPDTNSFHCFSCRYHLSGRSTDRPIPIIPQSRPRIKPKEGERKADPETLHAVYGRLLEKLSLSREHREHLTQVRGMSREEISRRGYKSLPKRGKARIAKRLLEEFGEDVLRTIPGFCINSNGKGKYPTISGSSGILLPIRDTKGRIVAFQVKADDTTGGKYKWISSKGREGGTGSGAPAHLARPRRKESSTLFITEGTLKADTASGILGADVISTPGVGNWRSGGVPQMVKELKPKVVAIAYDADLKENENVSRQREALAGALQSLGVPVFDAEWEESQGKGIDDLLLNGGRPEMKPRKRKGKRFQAIPGEMVEEPGKPEYHGLEEAREKLYSAAREIISQARPGANIISATIGAGKTQSVLQALQDLQKEGWPTVWRTRKGKKEPRRARALFVTDSKAAYEQWLPKFSGAVVREGRSPDPESPWYCREFETARSLGEKRHSPHWDLCRDCKERHGEGNWDCPYLRSVEATRKAEIVFAPKASFFNSSKELREFDIVIVDEDLLSILWETPTLGREQLQHYLDSMEKLNEDSQARGLSPQFSSDNPFAVMVHLLQRLLKEANAGENDWVRALPKLREIAEKEGVDLEGLVRTLGQTAPNPKTKRYVFERPFYPKGGGNEKIIPLRYFNDLIKSLEKEMDGRDDTRIWLTPEGLRLYLPRQHILDILKGKGKGKGKTLINLDATPSPLLDYIFPRANKVNVEVKEATDVTQVADALYTERSLRSRRTLARVGKAVDSLIQGSQSPVVFTHKAFDPDASEEGAGSRQNPRLELNHPNVRFGHFDYETRGLNAYSDADALVVVGHYCHPLTEIRAMAEAVRFAKKRDQMPGSEELRQYLWRSEDGTGAGFWHKCDGDPLVQQCIAHNEEANIRQAIGRGRPALRDSDNPLQVYLFTSTPVQGLKVDKFTTVGQILDKRRNMANFEASRTLMNKGRRDEAQERIRNAIRTLEERGQDITVRNVRKLVGGSFSTIQSAISQAQKRGVTDSEHINNYCAQCVTPPFSYLGDRDIGPPNEIKESILSKYGLTVGEALETCNAYGNPEIELHSGKGKPKTILTALFPWPQNIESVAAWVKNKKDELRTKNETCKYNSKLRFLGGER